MIVQPCGPTVPCPSGFVCTNGSCLPANPLGNWALATVASTALSTVVVILVLSIHDKVKRARARRDQLLPP